MIKHASFYFSCCYNRGIGSMGVTEHPLQKSQLVKFYYFSLGYIEGKCWNFWSFLAIFIKSHMMIVKTLSQHMIMVILHFWAKNVVFEQKWIHLSKEPVFHTNNSNGYRKHSLKNWAWSVHFSRFHSLWKFEIQRNKSEWCKTFFEEYICKLLTDGHWFFILFC